MKINGVEVSPEIIQGLRDGTSPAQWDRFWTEVSAYLKEQVVATPDEKLPQLKTKISHVEELRGLFREIFSQKKENNS